MENNNNSNNNNNNSSKNSNISVIPNHEILVSRKSKGEEG